MEEVWSRGEATVRDVQEALNERNEKARAYTTLLTVMTRLDGKGLLVRRRSGRLDIYAPALTRDDYLAARAEAEVSALVALDAELAARTPATFAQPQYGYGRELFSVMRRTAGPAEAGASVLFEAVA